MPLTELKLSVARALWTRFRAAAISRPNMVTRELFAEPSSC